MSVRVVSACGTVTEEIEVLEVVREDEADPAAPAPRPRSSHRRPPNWSLRPRSAAGRAFLLPGSARRAPAAVLVNSQLEPCLPVFPEEPSGMWTVLFGGAPEMSEQEIDTLCYQLQVCPGLAGLDTCGWKILSQVLFTETDDPEEYYESPSELRQKVTKKCSSGPGSVSRWRPGLGSTHALVYRRRADWSLGLGCAHLGLLFS